MRHFEQTLTCAALAQASYVLSLAQHFSDGLLSDDALYGASFHRTTL